MKKYKFRVLLYGGVVVLLIIMELLGNQRNKKTFLTFYNAVIEGRLNEIKSDQGAADILVGDKKFKFVPVFVKNETDFLYFAKKGDSVFKAAKSDTLKLIHHGKTYLYTFKKF